MGSISKDWSKRTGWPLIVLTGLLSAVTAANTQLTAGVTGTANASYAAPEGGAEGRWGAGLETGFDAGIKHQRGSHTLGADYNTTVNHRLVPDYRGQLTIGGNARYGYVDRAGRFDFNARHAASTNTQEDLIWLAPEDFTWQQNASAGAGVNFRPTGTLTLRLATRGGATFFQESAQNGQTWSNNVTLTRRLSQRDRVSGTLDRTLTFGGSTDPEVVIDSVELSYTRRLDNGTLLLNTGLTEARADDSTVLTGTWGARRIWARPGGQFTLGYNRTVTNTLLELTSQLPEAMEGQVPEADQEALGIGESQQIVGLGIRDQVQASHRTDMLCALCTLTVRGSLAQNEGMFTGDLTYDYGAGTTLRLTIDSLSSVSLGYGYQSESEDLFGTIVQTAQLLNLDWNRQLAEATTVSAGLSHAWNRGNVDSFRSEARVSLRHGLI